jgi:hypothetical protein
MTQTGLAFAQGLVGSRTVGDVFDCQYNQRLALSGRSQALRIENHDPRADRLEIVMDFLIVNVPVPR